MPLSSLFPAARLAGMHQRFTGFAEGFGIQGMKLSEHLPSTRKALAIAEYARDQGELEPFRQGAMELHWRKGGNLEDDTQLGALATEAGLDPVAAVAAGSDPALLARVDAAREEAMDAGVTGIPTFLFDRVRVVGCERYEVLAAAAERAGAVRRPVTS